MNPAIIIPTYNESQTIESLIKDLATDIPKAKIVIVDDDSPDGTAGVVKKLTHTYKHLTLLTRQDKSGRGSAVLHGFTKALKDPKITHVIEMDADRSHRIQDVQALIDATPTTDLVIASRYLTDSQIIGWPLYRHLFSRLANWYASLVLGGDSTDYTNGLRRYSRHAIEAIDLNSLQETGYVVLMEMYYKALKKDLTIKEIPSVFINRLKGTSNTTRKEITNATLAPLRIRTRNTPT